MKELGQALEISQLHRSVENISTFLEEKFIEDSDDLVQSSDKETTSHSKRKAFDSTSKRPSKRPSVNDFLESSENEDQTDDSIEDFSVNFNIDFQ